VKIHTAKIIIKDQEVEVVIKSSQVFPLMGIHVWYSAHEKFYIPGKDFKDGNTDQ
jgi:hypothetical protein